MMEGEDPCEKCGGHIACETLSYRREVDGRSVIVDGNRVVPSGEFLAVVSCNGMCCVIEDLKMDVNEGEETSGMKALHCACEHDEVRAVSVLLRLGARVNVLDKRGRSPLAIAAARGCVEVVKMLLEAGAKVNL